MKFLYHLLLLALILSTLAPWAQAQPTPISQTLLNLTHEGGNVLTRSHDRVVLAGSGMHRGVELLAGERAADYLRMLMAQHPDRFENLGRYLAEEGYVPTHEVSVARLIRFVPAEDQQPMSGSDFRLTTSTSTSEGVVVTHSWDDGDDATWEGSLYVESYSDGAWARYEAQVDIATADWEAIWAEAVAGGGSPDGDPFPARLNDPTSGLQQKFSHALLGRASMPLQSGIAPCFMTLPAQPWFQDFMTCVISGAAGCATACAFTGPGWGNCTSACAAGVYVTCALQTLLK